MYLTLFILNQLLIMLVMGSGWRQYEHVLRVSNVQLLSTPGCHIVESADGPARLIVDINNSSRPNWTDSPQHLLDSDCVLASSLQSTPLDQQSFDRVEYFLFHNSDIAHIDNGYFCSFKNVIGVFLDNNQLNDVTRIGFAQEDVRCGGDKLEALSLSGNPLVTIPNDSFSGLQQLIELNLANCQLVSIEAGAFNQLTQLTKLSLGVNHLTYFNYGKPDIQSSQLSHHSRVHSVQQVLVSSLPKLEDLVLSYNKLANASLTSFDHLPSLKHLNLLGNQLESIPNITGLANLTFLYLRFNLIRSIKATDLAGCNSLPILDLSYNPIRAIANRTLDGLRDLHSLSLQGNNITHLNQISIPSRITTLNLQYNILTQLALSDIPPNVTSLYLDHNMIEHVIAADINGNNYNSLALLELGSNRLTSVDNLSSLTKLGILGLGNNMLANMSFNSLNNFKDMIILSLDGNGLNFLPNITGLVQLYELNMGNNSLTSLKGSDFVNYNNIVDIDLSSNQISDIEDGTFDGLERLRVLDLSNNRIQSLNRTVVDTQLTRLYLGHNRLTEISFSQIPTSLQLLSLAHNMIGHVEMHDINITHVKLSAVDLSFNRLVTMDGALSLPSSIAVFDITNNPIGSNNTVPI